MTQIKATESPSHLAIKSLIQKFFDAINNADTVALGSHFFPHANLTILRQDPPRAPDGALYGSPQSAQNPLTAAKMIGNANANSSTNNTIYPIAAATSSSCGVEAEEEGKRRDAEKEEVEEKEKEKEQEKDTISVVLRASIERFIALLDEGQKRRKGQPGHQPTIHEQPDLDATDVKVDEEDGGLFGMAWCPFRVMFDGRLHHFGVLVFTLGKDGDGDGEWKVEGLTQSYRRTVGWGEEKHFM